MLKWIQHVILFFFEILNRVIILYYKTRGHWSFTVILLIHKQCEILFRSDMEKENSVLGAHPYPTQIFHFGRFSFFLGGLFCFLFCVIFVLLRWFCFVLCVFVLLVCLFGWGFFLLKSCDSVIFGQSLRKFEWKFFENKWKYFSKIY